MNKGLFITFEGGEACGKTTQVEKLKEYINSLPNRDQFVLVREPGGTELGEEIRKLILHYEKDKPLPMTEFMLFCAARCQIVEEKIKPALKEGKIVIADRFYDSSIAYQGNARGLMSGEEILRLTKLLIGDLQPNLTFYLKLSPQEAFKRKTKNLLPLDNIEREGMAFHEKVAEGYDYIANLEKDRFCVLDASKKPDEIFEIIKNELNKAISNLN